MHSDSVFAYNMSSGIFSMYGEVSDLSLLFSGFTFGSRYHFCWCDGVRLVRGSTLLRCSEMGAYHAYSVFSAYFILLFLLSALETH